MDHLAQVMVLSPVSPTGRPIAPGGWRRAVVGVLVGVAVGALAVVTARDGDR